MEQIAELIDTAAIWFTTEDHFESLLHHHLADFFGLAWWAKVAHGSNGRSMSGSNPSGALEICGDPNNTIYSFVVQTRISRMPNIWWRLDGAANQSFSAVS
jgi:hypothetical protein